MRKNSLNSSSEMHCMFLQKILHVLHKIALKIIIVNENILFCVHFLEHVLSRRIILSSLNKILDQKIALWMKMSVLSL